jgi:hypothetical protein
MSALGLLHQLHDLRITLVPAPDGTLHCRAPQGLLTPALVDAMRQHKAALLGLLAAPSPRIPDTDGIGNTDSTLMYWFDTTSPCRVCDSRDRWDDAGVWRCRACCPEPVTDTARQAEALERTRAQAPTCTRVHSKPRDPHLGPILAFCGCGDNRYWHDHTNDAWHCWTCVPPGQGTTAGEVRP